MSVQARAVRQMGGASIIILALALGVFFAAPERETPAPSVNPPLILPVTPGRTIGQNAVAKPSTSKKEGTCGGAAGPIVSRPEPASPPQGWFNSEDYPTWALIRMAQGVTTTDLVIDETGTVIGCGVTAASGHRSLDDRTCQVFRARAHFRPAKDDRGCPVASVWHQRVRWQIPRT